MFVGLNGTPIDVPPYDRYAAQAMGARWNEPNGTWYVPPDIDLALFAKWPVRRVGEPRLAVELVPKNVWASNVRDHVSREVWQAISRQVYRNANYRCEICAGQGEEHPVENHEVWSYENGVQRLVRCIALCPPCHLCKHPGYAELNGRLDEVYEQLQRVNRWNFAQAHEHIEQAFQLWEQRNSQEWALDMSYLEEAFGVRVESKRAGPQTTPQ